MLSLSKCRKGGSGEVSPAAFSSRLEPVEPPSLEQAVIAALGEGVCTVDERGWITSLNPEGERLLGWPETELAERDLVTTVFESHDSVTAARALEQRRFFRCDDCTFKCQDGSLFKAAFVLTPLEGGGAVLVFREADAQHHAEQSWRGAEEEYRHIYDNASEGIYRSSPDGLLLRANPALARLSGYETEAEMLAQVDNLARGWYVDLSRRDAFKRAIEANGRVENFESEVYRHKTRERIWISENARLVRDDHGKALYYEGTIEDITVRKRFKIFRDVLMEFVESSLQRGLDESFYQRLLERIIDTVPDAQGGSIMLRNEAGCYRFVAAVNFDLVGLQALVFYPHELIRTCIHD